MIVVLKSFRFLLGGYYPTFICSLYPIYSHIIFYHIDAMTKAIELCVDGADIYTVCQEVDAFIEDALSKTFSNKKSKKLERGIAFPCCISVNEVCGHFSPLQEDSYKLKMEDLVKVDLGAHIDGFPASCAHSFVIGGKTKGPQADVLMAAWQAF